MSIQSELAEIYSRHDFTLPQRAGFWRRFLAYMIDGLIVGIPFEVLAVLLYLVSGGVLQSNSFYTSCVTTKVLPDNLDPPAPLDANQLLDCRSSFFGLETGREFRALHVTTQTSGDSKRVFWTGRKYPLGPDSRPVNAASLDWIPFVALGAYLIVLQRRFGATLGMRALGIRSLDKREPRRVGLTWRGAIIRNLAPWLGLVPMFGVLALVILLGPGDFVWLALPLAAALGLLWDIWNLVQVIRKRDPPYDRLAGTAVVRNG
jgi:uncharacterized RDD family membrane protein YckC